jgi:S-DNA-T family DNA segregation ATPase FtsK/SpoIIIE
MAQSSGSNATRSRKNTSKSNTNRTSTTGSRKSQGRNTRNTVDVAIKNEVMLIVIFAVAIFAFLCVVGIIHGAAATAISNILFGLFGLLAYLMPVAVFLGFAFGISNKGNTVAVIKLVSGVILIFLVGIIAYMIMGQDSLVASGSVIKDLYETSVSKHAGGGVLFGIIAYGMYRLMGFVGTLFVVIVLAIISIVFITEKSFISGVKKSGAYIYETAHEDAVRMRQYRESRREEEYEDYYEDDEYDDDEEKYVEPKRPAKRRNSWFDKRGQEKQSSRKTVEYFDEPVENVHRMDKKARGVALSSSMNLKENNKAVSGVKQDIHEITLLEDETGYGEQGNVEEISLKPQNGVEYNTAGEGEIIFEETLPPENFDESRFVDIDNMRGDDFNEVEDVHEVEDIHEKEDFVNPLEDIQETVDIEEVADNENIEEVNKVKDINEDYGIHEIRYSEPQNVLLDSMPEPITENTPPTQAHKFTKEDKEEIKEEEQKIEEQVANIEEQAPKKYMLPPLNLLKKGEGKKGDTSNQLKETALKLQQTLQNFGVKVTITDISQGPSVTRYEMQPEQGVKVSKIVGLADDIKLNLAATDIRIEAPIPGKAAVGIEVPNKENSTVCLRDLLESDEFQKFNSNLAFAVGKDIGGQVVVTDIAKMPHVLIAGATGSGKSVCINTIIMSILYKADPSDVKLIMIDPKVVELSVYNGIPHLMIPVVTDPKKASAALNWGVTEMNDRYRKFAEINVRDLKGYNKAAETGKLDADGQPLHKLPQIVIIVDELADLMMVASNEVEESICRLAQLARACGIHLVIATQRPSVDVITGLIKANMPSRIAFSVSSGVDSRTILDMNGAEKLLGKGDMLFYPQGYPKPARVQGAFVSDSEVSDVVDFLKNQMLGNVSYNTEIENKIKTMQSSGVSGAGGANGGSDIDAYFVDAGKFVIEKDKASIGMLQRVFKIGFNRAARIVDQLEEAGVVGAEEGTKPRRILMSMEQFENYVEERL